MPDIAMYRSKRARSGPMPGRHKLTHPVVVFFSEQDKQPVAPIQNELPRVLCVFRKKKAQGES